MVHLIGNTVQRLLSPVFNSINLLSVRTNVRYSLQRPSEVKRYRRQSFKARLETKGRRNIMKQRILDGHKVIAH